ncbi:glutamate--cysteine ligase [Buchnera aphidicola]|uniref:glutamate--cysteine ligase n=1 Tax=Buchnera aphidicola TaxID=9 RepID=UPI00346386AE
MIHDISKKISWIKKNPIILQGIFRGLERETLRIKKNGIFSSKKHPYSLGSSLTHPWITTDFSENLLEFITPPSQNIDYVLNFLQDLHIFVTHNMKNEYMWPLSIPHFIRNKKDIKIAQYGNSNIGKIKYIYRVGLKHRYGSLVNTISGVHYNFSLPKIFWKQFNKNAKKTNKKEYISSGYLNLIRNYYRFGWIIPYLFGASPAISSCFLKNSTKHIFTRNEDDTLHLPWSTSLRLSDLGYTSTSIIDLNIMFNDLPSYIQSLKRAMQTTSNKFLKIGLKNKKGHFKQLNTNILQMESELYTQIRPKRTIKNGELLSDALYNKGIEYIEIRSLDINPFSPIGISKNQILFLDLLLIWCALIDAPKMDKLDWLLIDKNWKRIIFEGRKPNQTVYINKTKEKIKLVDISKIIFKDLEKIAKILDSCTSKKLYQDVCHKKILYFQYPELTYSSQFLNICIENGIKKTGLILAEKYSHYFYKKPFSILDKNTLEKETIRSHKKQKKMEEEDILSFEEYLKR